VAGGLAGGGFWAESVAATMSRPVQTKRRFIVRFLLRVEPLPDTEQLDAMIVALCAPVRESGKLDRSPVMMRRKESAW
jgi:hypothetical protein